MDYMMLNKQVENYVTRIFESPQNKSFPYHNFNHTQDVVQHSVEIGKYYALTDENMFIVRTAAWFHDIGHLYGKIDGHEETGIIVMKDYMLHLRVTEDVIQKVSDCIMATKYPSHPITLLEEIICDADTYHFGTPAFKTTDALVKLEMEIRGEKPLDNWTKGSLMLLEKHRFYTSYCRNLLDEGKLANITWLRSLNTSH